jgi:hypothetical protein
MGLPMLCTIVASTARPLLGSTADDGDTLPVIWRLRALHMGPHRRAVFVQMAEWEGESVAF